MIHHHIIDALSVPHSLQNTAAWKLLELVLSSAGAARPAAAAAVGPGLAILLLLLLLEVAGFPHGRA